MRLLKRRRKVTKSVKQQVFLEGRWGGSARSFASKRIMCVWFKVSVQSSESLSLVGLCDPGLLRFHHKVCIYLRLPLISSLTAVRLKQMRSESCFDWWLSGRWWVPLSSAGWHPLILSSFPQPFASFLFFPYVPFSFGSELSASPFFPTLSIPPLIFLSLICI